MQFINLSAENIEDQPIYCASTSKESKEGCQLKKDWLKVAFRNGYQFRKLDERGKVFLESVPIEHA